MASDQRDTYDGEIIDAHVHLYRSLDLEKRNVVKPGRRDRDRWGNPGSLGRFLDYVGVSNVVCLPNFPTDQIRESMVAQLAGTNQRASASALEEIDEKLREKLRRQNTWLCEVASQDARIIPTICIHKIFSSEEMVEEVRRGAGLGARAVKMLPGLYHESPDDRAFWPMYEEVAQLGIPIVSDTGSLDVGNTGIPFGEPIRFIDVLEDFPKLTLVMAHFPSAFWDQRAELARRYPNLIFDISGSFGEAAIEVRDGIRALAVDDAVRVMRGVGMDRFMFGSDGPRTRFEPALEQALSLDLDSQEIEQLMVANARRIFSI